MEQPSWHTSRELACPGGNAPIASRSSALRSSTGRSNGAATGARSNAAAVRTKTHSVIVGRTGVIGEPAGTVIFGGRQKHVPHYTAKVGQQSSNEPQTTAQR